MPENKNIKVKEKPMKMCYDEKQETKFVNNLDSIKITLIDAPSLEELMNYLPEFTRATWNDEIDSTKFLNEKERLALVKDAFFGRTLPTAQETINLMWKIEGISLQEVTHILRYRNAKFSADCSAEKWWHKRNALIPNSIQNCEEIYDKIKKNIEEAKQLYCDLIDTRKVSIADARSILPRCLETFYFMGTTFKDVIHIIKQRIDRQIQPETDNIIAYQMYIELLKKYPVLNNLIDVDAQDKIYLMSVGKQEGMYIPEEKNDVFEWNKENFMYPMKRSEMIGTNENAEYYFDKKWKEVNEKIKAIEEENDRKLKDSFDCTNEELDSISVRRRECTSF